MEDAKVMLECILVNLFYIFTLILELCYRCCEALPGLKCCLDLVVSEVAEIHSYAAQCHYCCRNRFPSYCFIFHFSVSFSPVMVFSVPHQSRWCVESYLPIWGSLIPPLNEECHLASIKLGGIGWGTLGYTTLKNKDKPADKIGLTKKYNKLCTHSPALPPSKVTIGLLQLSDWGG